MHGLIHLKVNASTCTVTDRDLSLVSKCVSYSLLNDVHFWRFNCVYLLLSSAFICMVSIHLELVFLDYRSSPVDLSLEILVMEELDVVKFNLWFN
jgi:hypothetical protein